MATINNNDDIPVRVSSGEQIASNAALELIGRDLIPAANQLAKSMRATTMNKQPPGYAYGTALPQGVQRRGNSYSSSGFQPQRSFEGISNTPSGHQLPTGVQRTGNSYSMRGATMPQPTPQTVSNTPYGHHTLPRGIQRNGNSYSYANGFAEGTMDEQGVQGEHIEAVRNSPFADFVRGMFKNGGNNVNPNQAVEDAAGMQNPSYMPADQQPNEGYADGTMTEAGAQYQPPGFMEQLQGMFQGNAAPEPSPPQRAPSLPGADAPTLDQSKQNYELQSGKLPGYANGTDQKLGVQKPRQTIETTDPMPYEQVARPANGQPMYGQTLPHLPAGNAPKTVVDDGQGGRGSFQFQDGRTLDDNQQASLHGIMAANAQNRDKYQANADAYAAGEAQKAQQAVIDRLLSAATTSPNAATQDISGFMNTRANQRAAGHVLPTVMNAAQQRNELAQTTEQNKAANLTANAKAKYDYDTEQAKLGIEREKLNQPEYGVYTNPQTLTEQPFIKKGQGAEESYRSRLPEAQQQLMAQFDKRINDPQYAQVAQRHGQATADRLYQNYLMSQHRQ
jgi:hypothetical protein